MTLVIGATGLLGTEICRRLSGTGRHFRALIRRTADVGKRAALEGLRAELVEGDLKDPASLRRACTGVRSVISTASSTLSRQEGDSIQTVDELGQMALVDAAKSAGVEHFVFVSFRDNPRIQYPLTEAKRAVERHLKASGMAYTILQASYFMEVWLSPMLGFDYANGKVRIYGDGNNKLSWVSYRDVAQVAVAALDAPRARNAVVELGGPQALSPREVVRIFEAAGAADIATEHVTEAALRAQMQDASDPLQKSFAGLMLQYASGDAIDMTDTLKVFSTQLTSVRDYVTAQLARR
jgi:uncharacterized protein YbjT (DUF2867 family)